MSETPVGLDALDLFTVEGVAKHLKVSVRTTWRLIKEGQIESLRVGARVRVTPEDLAAYISRQKTASQGAA